MILQDHFEAGFQLKEEELAEQFGVSRTPIRDVMRRLEAEMFVHRTDSQRSFIRVWTDKDMQELFDVRAMLESQAARLAASNVTAEQLAILAQTCDAMERLMAQDSFEVDDFSHQNHIFHKTVAEAAASTWLALTIDRITLMPQVHRTVRTYSRDNLIDTINEHRGLLRALTAGDPDWAHAEMVSHVRRAFHTSKQAPAKAATAAPPPPPQDEPQAAPPRPRGRARKEK